MKLVEMCNREETLEAVLDMAKERLNECDYLMVLMQKKQGGFVFYAPDEMRLDTASFMAQQFLHHLHASVEE